DGNGHPRRKWPSQDPGCSRQDRGRLQEAQEMGRHGRRLQRGTAAALYRQRREAAARRQRPAHAHQRRTHAPSQGAGAAKDKGKAEGSGEEEVDVILSLRSGRQLYLFPSISTSIKCGLPVLKAAATAPWMSSALVTCVPAMPIPLAMSTKPITGPIKSMCM